MPTAYIDEGDTINVSSSLLLNSGLFDDIFKLVSDNPYFAWSLGDSGTTVCELWYLATEGWRKQAELKWLPGHRQVGSFTAVFSMPANTYTFGMIDLRIVWKAIGGGSDVIATTNCPGANDSFRLTSVINGVPTDQRPDEPEPPSSGGGTPTGATGTDGDLIQQVTNLLGLSAADTEKLKLGIIAACVILVGLRLMKIFK